MTNKKIKDSPIYFRCSFCGSFNDDYTTYERREYDQEFSKECYKCKCPQKIFIPRFLSTK